MRYNNVGGIEEWLKSTESVISEGGKLRAAYNVATGKKVKLAPVIVQQSNYDTERVLKLFLAAGGVALVAWFVLMRKR